MRRGGKAFYKGEKTVYRKATAELNNFAEAPACVLTVNGAGRNTVLRLTEYQMRLINSRFERQFFIRCHRDKLISLIDDAHGGKELEQIAKKYGIADFCEFSDINLYGTKRLLKVIIKILYKYPRLRSRLTFLGSHSSYMKAVDKLCRGDTEVLKSFGLEYICSEKMARDLGEQLKDIVGSINGRDENYIATAVTAFGFFDAILFDEENYGGYAYIRMTSNLRECERSGFHPKGCASPESVVYHEIGHLLDYMLEINESYEFKRIYNSYSSEEIIRGLSEYGVTSTREMIAEAFAEYMCSPTPGEIARRIGELVDKKYGGV
jgi:hypothetical protein